jgi:beta-glucosidase
MYFHRFCQIVTWVLIANGAAAEAQSYPDAIIRAREIVSHMTLDEKISQMHGLADEDNYRIVPGLPRLGIPPLRFTNGPAGVAAGAAGMQPRATALPSPISLAATWNVDLARKYGEIEGAEAKALGLNLLEAPDVNMARVPQSGRVFEAYGEDPYLASRLAVANIEGIQSAGTIANVKHYLANNQETDRATINEIIGERPLREIYMPAFEASIKEAHVASVMCAYPRVNDLFNCENGPLLNAILREEWHFDGFIDSDFGATHSTTPSIAAGLDLEMPDDKYFSAALKSDVEGGKIPINMLDAALVRRYAKMIEFGLFQAGTRPDPIPILEHGKDAGRIAEESIVLLKNDGNLLPLDYKHVKSIAVLGPYSMHVMSGGGGTSHVIPFYSIEPSDGIAAHASHAYDMDVEDGSDLEEAVKAAKRRQIAIVVVGDNEGEDHDHSIALKEAQNKLVTAVAAVNPRTIVVLKTGAPVLMPWLNQVPAVLEAWYPGEEDGNAVARVIFGDVNPSAKLPVSFPNCVCDTLARNPDQYPGDHKTVHYSEGIAIGYRWFQVNHVKPLFPFGFGLSYSTFKYSDLHVIRTSRASSPVVTFFLRNIGSRTGAEVAQVYVGFPHVDEGDEPPRQLKGFRKVVLNPGESTTVSIQLDQRSFSYWSVREHQWKIPAGTFTIMVGSSSEDIKIEADY